MSSPAIRLVQTSGDEAKAQVADHLAELRAMEEGIARVAARRRVLAEFAFAYWAAKTKRPRYRMTWGDLTNLLARLDENGDDVSRLLWAIDGSQRYAAWKRLGEQTGERYDWLSRICRDNEWVERLAEVMPGGRAGQPHPMAVKHLGGV